MVVRSTGPRLLDGLRSDLRNSAQGTGAALLNSEGQKWMTVFRRERALLAKIEREKAEGQLISRDEAGQEWGNIVSVLCHGLELFADRLPPILHGRNRYEIFEILVTKFGNCEMAFLKMADTLPRLTANRGQKIAVKKRK